MPPHNGGACLIQVSRKSPWVVGTPLYPASSVKVTGSGRRCDEFFRRVTRANFAASSLNKGSRQAHVVPAEAGTQRALKGMPSLTNTGFPPRAYYPPG